MATDPVVMFAILLPGPWELVAQSPLVQPTWVVK